jgi:hypothetical protein
MAKQTIDVGNYPSDGTGDPLRDAFNKINQNFDELYSGNVQVTAANVLVYSVAGRTGNVSLTVNDIVQAASKSYVNNAIASNVANLVSLSGANFTGNVSASNILTTGTISSSQLQVGITEPNLPLSNFSTFVGNVIGLYGLAIQNKNNNAASITGYAAFSNGDINFNHFAEFGITNSNYTDPRYPKSFPYDAYVYTYGGNLLLDSETHDVKIITSNIARLEVLNSGTVRINSNITFADSTLQTTAFAGNTNIGFTMTTPSDWTAPVYTVHDALNQIAARLKALES